MRDVRILVAVFCLVAVGQLGAAGPFDGTWTARVVRPAPAGPQNLTISLATADNGKVTGTVMIEGGGTPMIDWGFVKDDLVVFKVKMPFNGQDQPFVYVGRVEGSSIAFGRRPEDLTLGQLVKFSAERAK